MYTKEGISTREPGFDYHDEPDSYRRGALGNLILNFIHFDCINHTYRLVELEGDTKVWRPAQRLPALAPVFKFARVFFSEL